MRSSASLVLVFGASGSGKTTLLQGLVSRFASVSIHRKGTDRPPKKYDAAEIETRSEVMTRDYDYVYSQYGHRYGIQSKQIDDALAAGKDHFVICNDIDTIVALKGAYPRRSFAVYLMFDAPRDIVEMVQRNRGIKDDDVRLRLQKIAVLADIYLDNHAHFDAVIVNRLGSPVDDLISQLRRTIGIPRDGSPIEPLTPAESEDLASKTALLLDQQRREARPPSMPIAAGYLFVVMAASGKDPLLEDAFAAIKRAAGSTGFRCERIDDVARGEDISDKILGSIRLAEFVIADLTHSSPNVYYEVGYAHACQKTVILLARQRSKPPLGILEYPVLFYASASELEQKLAKRLKALAEHPIS